MDSLHKLVEKVFCKYCLDGFTRKIGLRIGPTRQDDCDIRFYYFYLVEFVKEGNPIIALMYPS